LHGQPHECDSRGIVGARRGFTYRSRYQASCFHWNKFSAVSRACDRTSPNTNRATAPTTRRIVPAAVRDRYMAMIEW